MIPIIFDDEIQRNAHTLFIDWFTQLPNAFFIVVINKAKKLGRLHRANCPNSRNMTGNDFSFGRRRKICARTIRELKQWEKHKKEVKSVPCKNCKPYQHESEEIEKKEYDKFVEDLKKQAVIEQAKYARGTQFLEGALRQILVNTYERDPNAREECLQHHGYDCFICGFNFKKIYGEHGACFIHVHHLNQLAKRKKQRKVNPKLHLRPVCPNCHAMIHRGSTMLKIEDLKMVIQKQNKGKKLLRLFDGK